MKTKMNNNRMSQLMEQNYIENHPFHPKLMPNSNKNVASSKNLFEEMNNTKIPIYEKLYK